MKKISTLFTVLTLVLSHLMCITVSLNYGYMLCGERLGGFSAPPRSALLYALPFLAAIAACGFTAWYFHKKELSCGKGSASR